MKQPKIMFVTYGAGHAGIVAHLLPQIKGTGLPVPTVLALTTAKSQLKDSPCKLLTCSDLLSFEGYGNALDIGAELGRDLWQNGGPVSWQETCAYLGVSMCDLIAEHGVTAAREIYALKGRTAFCPIRFMTKVLELEQPDLLVTTCHVRMERAATLAAKSLGIRSVLIEDLFGYSLLGIYPFGQRGNLIPSEEWPDMAVVMNETVRDVIIKNGFPPDRVTPLGQPAISSWKKEQQHLNLKSLFEEDQRLVSYFTTPISEILVPQTKVLKELAAKRVDLNFIIKLHPSTQLSTFMETHGPFSRNVRVLSEEPALAVVKSTDLAILYRSTVGITCLTSGTPMIVWNTLGEPEVLPYVSSGAASEILDFDGIEDEIDRRLHSLQMSGQTRPHPFFDVADNAAEKIVEWMSAGAPKNKS